MRHWVHRGEAVQSEHIIPILLMNCNLMLRRTPLLLVVVVCLLLPGYRGAAQVADSSQGQDASTSGTQRPKDVEPPWVLEQRQEMVKKQNEQRQQELKKDADKLLDLATELKQYVDKTNENIISLDVIKKAEQIEKLAKSVKDKMKGQ